MSQVVDSTPTDVKAWLDQDQAILIDVREPGELAQTRIPGALHMPLSAFNPDQVPTGESRKLVFLCAHGVRSFQVSQYLLDQGLLKEVYHVVEGIVGWQRDGLPVETG